MSIPSVTGLSDTQGAADLPGDHHAAQFVDSAYNTCRFQDAAPPYFLSASFIFSMETAFMRPQDGREELEERGAGKQKRNSFNLDFANHVMYTNRQMEKWGTDSPEKTNGRIVL